jgi:hypothetical protein
VTGLLLRGCELRIQPSGSAHVSYWTNAAGRGRGCATRSLALLLHYARSIGIRDAEAHIAADTSPAPDSCEVVTVTADDHSLRVDIEGETVAIVPWTTNREIHRYKAYATRLPRSL